MHGSPRVKVSESSVRQQGHADDSIRSRTDGAYGVTDETCTRFAGATNQRITAYATVTIDPRSLTRKMEPPTGLAPASSCLQNRQPTIWLTAAYKTVREDFCFGLGMHPISPTAPSVCPALEGLTLCADCAWCLHHSPYNMVGVCYRYLRGPLKHGAFPYPEVSYDNSVFQYK